MMRLKEQKKKKKMVEELVCRDPESTRCSKPDVVRVIYVDYNPYRKLELTEEMFNTYNKYIFFYK